jgi:preprotein translocase subunit SecA
MFVRLLNLLFGSKNERELKKFQPVIDHINSLEGPLEALSSDGILQRSESFKKRLTVDESLDAVLPEAFALCREASKRILGLRHFVLK